MNVSGVSTLLPVYLRSSESSSIRNLRRAVESVLSQEGAISKELLIIDDGCAAPLDENPGLRAVFDHPAVTSIRLTRNRGLVYALNAGLSRARYNLIARIDADDSWRPLKLKTQCEAFLRDPDLSLLGTGMRLVHGDPKLDRDEVRGADWNGVLEFFDSTGCPFPHGSILARKDVYRLLGGYSHAPGFRHGEDFALWGNWVRFFRCAILPDILYEYSISPGQISSLHPEQQRLATELVRGAFSQLGDFRQIPRSVSTVADFLEKTVLETGKMLCVAWRHYSHILTEDEIFDAISALMPDRRVYRYSQIRTLAAERFFYFHRHGRFDRDSAAHAFAVHDDTDIAAVLDHG